MRPRTEIAASVLSQIIDERADGGVPPFFATVGSKPPAGASTEEYLGEIAGIATGLAATQGLSLEYDPLATSNANRPRPRSHTDTSIFQPALRIALNAAT